MGEKRKTRRGREQEIPVKMDSLLLRLECQSEVEGRSRKSMLRWILCSCDLSAGQKSMEKAEN